MFLWRYVGIHRYSLMTRLINQENIWRLCRELPSSDSLMVVFCSNTSKQVAFRLHAEQEVVVWDYHVFAIEKNRRIVYDFDSSLPFPCSVDKYISATFFLEDRIPAAMRPRFRVIPAKVYLEHFASDRSHMRLPDGSGWASAPPDYPPISTAASKMNLPCYLEMNDSNESDCFGEVYRTIQEMYQAIFE